MEMFLLGLFSLFVFVQMTNNFSIKDGFLKLFFVTLVGFLMIVSFVACGVGTVVDASSVLEENDIYEVVSSGVVVLDGGEKAFPVIVKKRNNSLVAFVSKELPPLIFKYKRVEKRDVFEDFVKEATPRGGLAEKVK